MNWSDVGTLAPIVIAVLTAAAVLVVDFAAPGRRAPAIAAALVGLTVVALVVLSLAGHTETAFGGAYVVDGLTAFLDLLFVAIAALTILFANDYLEPRGLPIAEFAAVLIFAITGAMLIAGSADLLLLFVALELMVLPGYLLAGFARNDPYSTEGAIKYFLLGSFSSAILLFGLAYVWGLTGSTRVTDVAAALARVATTGSIAPGLAMGLAFMTAGVAFKMAAVPFHYWTPDAYQGSPTPVTAYLSVGPKIGAFAIALRLFVAALGPLKADWLPIVIVLAALTMTLGNLVAITQDNVKRMLAYSSIAHTGYILVGLAAYAGGQHSGISAILFYGAAYTFMNMGAFAVVTALQRRPGVSSQISTFAGLGRRDPWLAALMTLFLLSLTGIPPLAGFWAKAYVIVAAIQAGGWLTALAVLAMLNAAAAAFYYLRVVVYMYMREPAEAAAPLSPGLLFRVGLAVTGVVTLVFGLFPAILNVVSNAADVLKG
ncbi:MAG: NADH-quinone oxidoreductase subunit N [Candidatus Limnocylindrales bacterium]|jgi:NADH-quinone oxidoreductase subunit N